MLLWGLCEGINRHPGVNMSGGAPMASQPYPQQRRTSRLQFPRQVRITGKDPAGKEFSEETETLSISKFGASLRTSRQYEVGQMISLRTKDGGHVGQFQVVWMGQPGARDAGQVGVQWVDARQFWGIDTAPEDWATP